MIVSDKPRQKHRVGGRVPSRHVETEKTLPQHRAEYVIKAHNGSMTSFRTRRAAQ